MKHAPLAAAVLLAIPALAQNGESEDLQAINVKSSGDDTRTEDTRSYTTAAMRTTTGLALAPQETPQSVSVVTKTQLDERGITTMHDALKTTTGINVIPDAGRWRYQSRGFYVDKIEEDGIASTVPGAAGNPYNDPQSMSDLAIYDHIEVVRGATGLIQSNGEPGGTINAVRKKPTAATQASASLQADRFGKVYGTGDLSGSLNQAQTLRGRVVGVSSRNKNWQKKHAGNDGTLYGVLETDLGDSATFSLGGMYQSTQETPDFYGVPMGRGFNLNLPTKGYLGADWNRKKYKKANVFAELDYAINDNWDFNSKLNYVHAESDEQFAFISNTSGKFTGVEKKMANWRVPAKTSSVIKIVATTSPGKIPSAVNSMPLVSNTTCSLPTIPVAKNLIHITFGKTALPIPTTSTPSTGKHSPNPIGQTITKITPTPVG